MIPKGQMQAPSYEQVEDFALKRKSHIDPKDFWLHYEIQGWKRTNGMSVDNWKAAFVDWERKTPAPAPPERFRERDALVARRELIYKFKLPEARDWEDELCLQRYYQALELKEVIK